MFVTLSPARSARPMVVLASVGLHPVLSARHISLFFPGSHQQATAQGKGCAGHAAHTESSTQVLPQPCLSYSNTKYSFRICCHSSIATTACNALRVCLSHVPIKYGFCCHSCMATPACNALCVCLSHITIKYSFCCHSCMATPACMLCLCVCGRQRCRNNM